MRSTAPDGVCTSIGIYTEDTPIPIFEMYLNVVTFRTGRAHARPAIPALIQLVTTGRIHPELITSDVVPWEDAPTALANPPKKLVIARSATKTS